MNRAIIIVILFISFRFVIAGDYADSFMELGVSSRALAMANTLSALDFSGTSFFSNPAGLAYLRDSFLGLSYSTQFGLANYNYIGLAIPISKKSAAAVSWIRFGVDDIPLRPDIIRQVPNPETRRDSVLMLSNIGFKTFQDVENVVFISYGKYSKRVVNLGWRYSKINVEIPWGINFKFIQKKIYNVSAYGLGIDIGGRLRISGSDLTDITNLGKISVGFSLRDVTGTTVYWNTKRQDKIRLGPVLSFAFEQPFRKWNAQLNVGLEKEYRYDDKMHYGMEAVLFDRFSFRGGYRNPGFTFGFGLNFKVLNKFFILDYAFLSHDLGANHRIGGGIIL